MSKFDLNLKNYTKVELEEMFQLTPTYTDTELLQKEQVLRENILSDRTFCQNRQVVKLMRVLHKQAICWNNRFFSVHAAAEVMLNFRFNKIHFYSSSKLLLDAACMMTQLVPSDTIVAQFPITANKIAVPANVLSIGTMLDAAELTSCACIFLTVIDRPVQEDAAGKVNVNAAPVLLLIIQVSVLVIV